MTTTICYKTKEPTVYNKGTAYESQCDTFLAYYTYKDMKEAQQEVDTINSQRPGTLFNGEPIDWTAIDHFFVSQQEEMY